MATTEEQTKVAPLEDQSKLTPASDQPKVTLHWLDNSRAQSTLWLLEELDIPYEVEIYHRNKETYLAPPELKKVHPLGKSPVVTIVPAGGDAAKPIVLAEGGWTTSYLCDHFPKGAGLVPTRWKDGMEGKIGGETDDWMRYQYLLHYSEGSFMPILVMSLIIGTLKSPRVPFFVRPITSSVANRIFAHFIFPNAKSHIAFLDQQLSASSGPFMCGESLTAADILICFPLTAARGRLDSAGPWEGGSWEKAYPRVSEYLNMLQAQPGFVKSKEKMEKLDGKNKMSI